MAELVPGNRLSVCLPVNSPEEQLAAARVTAFVRERFGGLTVSRLDSAAFRGHWYDPQTNILYEDAIAVLQTDHPDDLFPAAEVAAFAEDVRAATDAAYEAAGSRQLEIWVVIEQLTIYRA